MSRMPTRRELDISVCDEGCDLGKEDAEAITEHVLSTGHTVVRIYQVQEFWDMESVAARELRKALKRKS